MRPLLILFAVGAGILLVLSFFSLANGYYARSYTSINTLDSLKGFQNSAEVPGLKELKESYSTKIQTNKVLAEKEHDYWLWLSFIVTALTAGATLVSSLKAVRNNEANAKTALIIVAVLTFLSSLGTWGAGQINETRNAALEKVSRLTDERNKFYLDFQKASDDQKAGVVEQYKGRLDPI